MWYAMIILFGIVGAVTTTQCLSVQQCNKCEDCIKQFKPNEAPTLTCSLDNVSKKLDLHWIVVDNDVEYNETRLEIKNNKSGTWNISITLLFVSNPSSCDQNQTCVCYAKNDGQMVTKTNRTVHIQPNNCVVNTKWLKLVVLAAGILLLFVLVLGFLPLQCRKEDTLMESLKQIYIPYREYWCGESQYEVKYIDKINKLEVNTVDALLAALSTDPKDKRVLFIGESGIGKSRLFRTMAKKWMDGEILQDVILIYLQLEYLSTDSNILEALEASLRSDKNSVTVDSLRMGLQNKRSIVMLDGISNVGRLQNTTQNNDNTNGLTVKQLLLGDENTYKNMKIWITCRSQNDAEQFIGGPVESHIKVNFLGFTNPQRDKFFARCLPVNGNSINDIANAWQDYIKDNPDDNFDGRYSSPLLAQLFVRYYSQTDTIKHLMKFTKSKWKDLEKVDNFHLLVCLLEAFFQDKDEYREHAKTFHQKKVVFKYITDDYFQEATLHLWQVLNETDRHLKTLEVNGDFPVHLMKNSPTIDEQVVFPNIRLSDDKKDNTSLLGITALQKCNKVKFSNRTLHTADITSQQTD